MIYSTHISSLNFGSLPACINDVSGYRWARNPHKPSARFTKAGCEYDVRSAAASLNSKETSTLQKGSNRNIENISFSNHSFKVPLVFFQSVSFDGAGFLFSLAYYSSIRLRCVCIERKHGKCSKCAVIAIQNRNGTKSEPNWCWFYKESTSFVHLKRWKPFQRQSFPFIACLHQLTIMLHEVSAWKVEFKWSNM